MRPARLTNAPTVALLLAMALAARGHASETSESFEAPAPVPVDSVADALQVSHRLIGRVSTTFACDVPYDVVERKDDEPRFVTRIFSKEPNCERMSRGLNTWDRLFGIRFDLTSPKKVGPIGRFPETADVAPRQQPSWYDQALIHEIDPADDASAAADD